MKRPDTFIAVADRRDVIFTWTPPSGPAAPITCYTLFCSPSLLSLLQSFPNPGEYKLTGFVPSTFYSCSLFVYNFGVAGPVSITNFTTKDDCK